MNHALPRRGLTFLATAALALALVPSAVLTSRADDPVSEQEVGEEHSPTPEPGTVPDPATVGETREDVPEVGETAIDLETVEAAEAETPGAEVPAEALETEESPVLDGVAARVVETPEVEMIGFTWGEAAAPDRVELRSLNGEDGWGDWTVAELVLAEDGVAMATEALWIGDATQVEVRSSRAGQDTTAELEAVLIDSDEVAQDDLSAYSAGPGSSGPVVGPMNVTTPGVLAPSVISRAGWGADESWTGSSPRYASETKAVVLHHTAGSNSYSRT